MFNTKYVMSKGLGFAEYVEMQMLSEYASKGWILCKFGFLGYKLKKGTPQKLQYSLDYRNNADKEYFSYFKEAGWHHVCSMLNVIHIFSAPEGTKPIYTDINTESEKYMSQYKCIKVMVVPLLLFSALFFVLVLLAKYNYIPDIYRIIFGIALLLTVPLAVITTVSCVLCYRKANELEKVSTFSKKHKIIDRLSVIVLIVLVFLFILRNLNIISMSNAVFYLIFLISFLLNLLTCFTK
ncbi:DUF2812 domain-containing protein [Clostridium sp. P21]|uniref:DUF2812 domain-containing protein n=1 Tax=Clostridium muellerianum TaxID=2716538 RepID=A0A7Y0EM43_9CLOT|nr:DUF2812 domain-containing protein [Clostridium muellerianum]NMM65975.1 DUF2812 domain-containing protein [Clostridium muellerianum]